MSDPVKVEERWAGEVILRREVKVDGAPLLVVPAPRHLELVKGRRYQLHTVTITNRWTPGAVGTLQHFVTLQVWEVIGPHVLKHRDGKLYLDQLREVPDWLQSIVDRGSVVCRCRYLGTAPGGEEPAEVDTTGCAIHLLDLLAPPPPGDEVDPF